MNHKIYLITISIIVLALAGCSKKIISFTEGNITTVNRDILKIQGESNAINIKNKEGAGMVVLNEINFQSGIIELELKGENNPGRSFVGLAFNIQNDTIYEAIYFRPFNFQSPEQIRREHSIQYISMPDNEWSFLRTNFEGQYEAEFPRRPSPDEWFTVDIKITSNMVLVYDKDSGQELLTVNRLQKPMSSKIGLWTRPNSKGSFRNLRIKK